MAPDFGTQCPIRIPEQNSELPLWTHIGCSWNKTPTTAVSYLNREGNLKSVASLDSIERPQPHVPTSPRQKPFSFQVASWRPRDLNSAWIILSFFGVRRTVRSNHVICRRGFATWVHSPKLLAHAQQT